VPEAHRLRIQKAFLDLAATPEGARLLARVPMQRPIAANVADYDIITSLNLERFQLKEGK
jgi:phosphonate transport system substrate-binding protein